MKSAFACIVALLLLHAGGASAQLYKWLDYNGRTRYGDVPPPGVEYTRLKPPPPLPSAPADASGKSSSPPTPAELEIEYRKRQLGARAQQEKEERSAAEAEAKAGNCERAKEGLRSLESGRRIARFGADGEQYFLDATAIEAEKAAAQRIIEANCK